MGEVADRLRGLLSSNRGSMFRQNFMKVAQANVLSQLLLLISAPILTRLFEPSDFAVVALFTAALQIVGCVCTFCFNWSMPNTKTYGAAACLFIAGIVALATTCVVVLTVILWDPPLLAHWKGYHLLGALLLLLPFAVFGHGLQLLFQGWYVREGDLTAVSRTKILQSVGNVTISLVLGFMGAGAAGLVVASVAAVWLGLGVLMRGAGVLLTRLTRLTAHRVRGVARRFMRQASISTTVSLLNAISSSAAILLLAQVYSATELGWFSFMLRMAVVPLSVVSTALSQSFWSHAAELARAGNYSRLNQQYLKVLKLLSLVALAVITAYFGGSFLVAPIFGADWAGAADVLRALSPMLIGIIVVSPVNHLIVFGRQDLQLAADITRLVLMILSTFLAASLDWGFTPAVLAVSLSSFLGHLVLLAMHLLVHRRHLMAAQNT